MLSIKLAEQIVLQTKEKLHHNINVISTDGVILASRDQDRIDCIHEGALEVIKSGKPVYIDEATAKQLQNSKPGVNLPIHFHEQLIGVIGITGEPESLREIGSLVQLTTEMIVHQVLSESQSEWQRKNGDFIFKALIDHSPIDADMMERIQKLPFLMKGPYQIILLKPTIEMHHQLSLQLENLLYRQASLFGQTDLHEYYIFLCGEQMQIMPQLQKLQQKFQLSIGVGPIVHELEQLPFAYTSTKTSLVYSTSNRITYFQDIEIHTVFKNKSTIAVEKFATKLAQLSDKLLQTLEVFFDCNLQLNACANAMQIHRHTLKYRLNQITELTGYNPLNFEDAFTLKVALILKSQQ